MSTLENSTAFDKVIGYDNIKKELMLYSDVIKNPGKYERLGVKKPGGILLEGPAGLGKTLMAKCFIEESMCLNYTIRKRKSSSEFVNVIRETYEKAKSDDCAIVFLDDMDKFSGGGKNQNSDEFVAIQSCIDSCRKYNVFTIATANDTSCFPHSLIRPGRFDRIISVDFPTGEDFRKIIKYFLESKQVSVNLDFEEIERLMDFRSCAELETIINDAGIYAGFENRECIEQKDIVKACFDRVFETRQSLERIPDEELRMAAVHEAGHTVVSEVLSPGSVNFVSVNSYRGIGGGVTKLKAVSSNPYDFKEIERKVMGALAGKAATELVYGIADVGCNKDLMYAEAMLFKVVNDLKVYGFEVYEGPCSDYLLEKRDRLIETEIDRLYGMSKNILIENRHLLDLVSHELEKKETLTFRDLQKIKMQEKQIIQWGENRNNLIVS